MKYNELIEKALQLIKEFNPVVYTIDSFADMFLEKVTPLIQFEIPSRSKWLMKKYSSSNSFTGSTVIKYF
jgi:hypothetical protein